MTDNPDTPSSDDKLAPSSSNGAAAPNAAQIKNRVVAQYVRDLSFENVLAQKGITGNVEPQVQVRVNLDGRKRGAEGQYEVITKLQVESTSKESGDKLFVLELEYAGVFQIEGVPDQQMHPYLLVECPRITFPYVRRIVSDVTRDGGFVPLNLEMIDFLALYRQEIMKRAQERQAGEGGDSAPPSGTA